MDITHQDLHRALRSAIRGELSEKLNSLECLSAYSTRPERARALLELLGKLIRQAYLDQQIASDEPKPSDLARIRHDSRKLIVGVLYWHYFAPVPLSLLSIAQASRITLNTLNKHRKAGLWQLLTNLMALENQALLERLRNQSLVFPRIRLTKQLINKQQELMRKLMDQADEFKRLFLIGGLAGSGKSSTVLYLDTIVERTRQLIWIEVQPNYLDRYGVIQPLPYAVRDAETIIARMCEGLALPHHDTLEAQLNAIERYSESAVIVINRVDALMPQEFEKLQAALTHISRHVIVMTTRYHFRHPYGVFMQAPEIHANQSRLIMEHARKAEADCTPPELNNETFDRLYNLVGGNPLALTILGTHLAHNDAAQAEHALRNAEPPFNALFDYILHEPWQCLSKSGRSLLCYLCSHDQEQFSEQQLRRSDLSDQEIAAIEEVARHYLIECLTTDDSRIVRPKPLVRTAIRSGIYAAW